MGMYLNPVQDSKEKWLQNNATEVSKEFIKSDYTNLIENKELPIVLLDNGMFTAAGVCYNESEVREFTREDGRPKKFYVVSMAKLKEEFCKTPRGQMEWGDYSCHFE